MKTIIELQIFPNLRLHLTFGELTGAFTRISFASFVHPYPNSDVVVPERILKAKKKHLSNDPKSNVSRMAGCEKTSSEPYKVTLE